MRKMQQLRSATRWPDLVCRYWISQAHDQNEFGTTVRAHEEANSLLIAPGCSDAPIVLEE
jgi:hypothetical protein